MSASRSVRLVASALVALAVLVVAPRPASAAPARPNATTYSGAIFYNLFHPREAPPGANDWTCRPSAAHPQPVVLIHGTFGNMTNAFQRVSPELKNQGYCVYAFDYGAGVLPYPIQGIADIRQSAKELNAFVDKVKASTGTAKVDLVGHSQGGGILPRWYLKYEGGAAEVRTLVGIAPSNHGTTLLGLGSLARAFGIAEPIGAVAPAAEQQIIGSDLNRQLDAGGDTMPGVRYVNLVSRYDEVVTPYTNQFLSGPNVTNTVLQDGCEVDFSEHLGIAYSPRAMVQVTNALDPAHPRRVPCTLQLIP